MTEADIKTLIQENRNQINTNFKAFFRKIQLRELPVLDETENSIFAIALLYCVRDVYSFHTEKIPVANGKAIKTFFAIKTSSTDDFNYTMSLSTHHEFFVRAPEKIVKWFESLPMMEV